jgi:myo-inositol catabolism protein IolC
MKDQLAKLIEAYAAAKASGNLLLLEFAAGKLNALLAEIEVTPKEAQE